MADRYEEHQITDDLGATQGSNRFRADIRRESVKGIDMESYEVNAPAVAAAILERLLAGSALDNQPRRPQR